MITVENCAKFLFIIKCNCFNEMMRQRILLILMIIHFIKMNYGFIIMIFFVTDELSGKSKRSK